MLDELFACWVILHVFVDDFFYKLFRGSFKNTISVSNGSDPDQVQRLTIIRTDLDWKTIFTSLNEIKLRSQ